MSVRPGGPWGRPGRLAPGGVVVNDDTEAAAVVGEALAAGRPLPPLGLLGGDLCRTLGGTGDRSRLTSEAATTFEVDLGTVSADGRAGFFVAHLVARRPAGRLRRGRAGEPWAWRGRVMAVMNAEWIGAWDVAPRAHPGDGRLDILDADLSWGDRMKARRRLRTGTHVPHPSIRERRAASWRVELRDPLEVWLDGSSFGTAMDLVIGLEPDALTVVV